MALDPNERLEAFTAARLYINQYDAGIHVTDPMLNGLLDAVIAALEPVWAVKAAAHPAHSAPKHKTASKTHPEDND